MLIAEARSKPKASDVVAIARELGMQLVSTSEIDLEGHTYPQLEIACRDNTEALKLLNRLAALDAAPDHAERTHALAARLWAEEGRDPLAFARRAHAVVRDAIDYVDDPKQVFRSSDVTIALGYGNCVNTARLLCALAMCVGLEARAMPIRPHGREITHTAAQIRARGAWHWCEATIAARFDEEPLAAARRLGILREDIATRVA
jgi:hypothetical protein